jgi:hypothetical protein
VAALFACVPWKVAGEKTQISIFKETYHKNKKSGICQELLEKR